MLFFLVFPCDGRAAYTLNGRFAIMHYTRRARLTATGIRADTVFYISRPSGLPNIIVTVGLHASLLGSMGQSHLRRSLHSGSSSYQYCVLAGTCGSAVTTISTTMQHRVCLLNSHSTTTPVHITEGDLGRTRIEGSSVAELWGTISGLLSALV